MKTRFSSAGSLGAESIAPFVVDAPEADPTFWSEITGAIVDAKSKRDAFVFDRRTGEVLWDSGDERAAKAAVETPASASAPIETIGYRIVRLGALPIFMTDLGDAIERAENDPQCIVIHAVPSGEQEWGRWGGFMVMLDNSHAEYFWDRRDALKRASEDPNVVNVADATTGELLYSRHDTHAPYTGREIFEAIEYFLGQPPRLWTEIGAAVDNYELVAKRLERTRYHHGNPPNGRVLRDAWDPYRRDTDISLWDRIAARLRGGSTIYGHISDNAALADALLEADKRWSNSEDNAETDQAYWGWMAKVTLEILGAKTGADPTATFADHGTGQAIAWAAEEAEAISAALRRTDEDAPLATILDHHVRRLRGLARR